ncbi:MAG: hypothetical protein P4L50_09740 [Anaerolineaceae bacterium]|nr:hypothetical protein [Anaerolineaceae bacterium]
MAETILDLLKKLAASGNEIYLLNVYKGVPLSYAAKIIEVSDFYARVLTDTYQTVGMYIEKTTYIQSQWLPDILRADVIELDSREKTAILANFSYVTNGIGKRMQVRIQPKETLEGSIQNIQDNRIVRAELADISQEGFAFYLPKLMFSQREYFKGAQLKVTLQLPGDYKINQSKTDVAADNNSGDRFSRNNVRNNPVNSQGSRSIGVLPGNAFTSYLSNPKIVIRGIVANIRAEETHARYRIGARILSTDPPWPLIPQFISQRQAEIIKEIRLMGELLAKNAWKK